MPWVCEPGACLLVPSGPEEFRHLFAVAVGPQQFDGYGAKPHVIMVSVTSVKPEFPFDSACVIRAGCACSKHGGQRRMDQPRALQRRVVAANSGRAIGFNASASAYQKTSRVNKPL